MRQHTPPAATETKPTKRRRRRSLHAVCPTPCLNNWTCRWPATDECMCPPGWTGKKCEKPGEATRCSGLWAGVGWGGVGRNDVGRG